MATQRLVGFQTFSHLIPRVMLTFLCGCSQRIMQLCLISTLLWKSISCKEKIHQIRSLQHGSYQVISPHLGSRAQLRSQQSCYIKKHYLCVPFASPSLSSTSGGFSSIVLIVSSISDTVFVHILHPREERQESQNSLPQAHFLFLFFSSPFWPSFFFETFFTFSLTYNFGNLNIFLGARNWAQGPVHTQYILYYWATVPAPW